MMQMLNRPMIKEALVLLVSGVLSAMVCSRVYAAPATEAEPAPPAVTTSAPAPGQYAGQLQPMSKEEGRQLLLSSFHGQFPLGTPTPAPAPATGR